MCIIGPKCIYYAAEEKINSRIACLCWCIVFLFIGAIVAISFWIHYEIRTASDLKEISKITSDAISLPRGQQGIEDIQNNPAYYNGKIIYLGDIKLNPTELTDTDFNLKLNTGVLTRHTEYC